MRITFNIPEFTRNERKSHCDVLHITPVRVANLVLDDAIAAIQMLIPLSQLSVERRPLAGNTSTKNYRQWLQICVPLPYELINVLFEFSTYHEYSSFHPMTFQNFFFLILPN